MTEFGHSPASYEHSYYPLLDAEIDRLASAKANLLQPDSTVYQETVELNARAEDGRRVQIVLDWLQETGHGKQLYDRILPETTVKIWGKHDQPNTIQYDLRRTNVLTPKQLLISAEIAANDVIYDGRLTRAEETWAGDAFDLLYPSDSQEYQAAMQKLLSEVPTDFGGTHKVGTTTNWERKYSNGVELSWQVDIPALPTSFLRHFSEISNIEPGSTDLRFTDSEGLFYQLKYRDGLNIEAFKTQKLVFDTTEKLSDRNPVSMTLLHSELATLFARLEQAQQTGDK